MSEEAEALLPARRVRCVVVEDHVMVLQMLCGTLRTLGGLEIVATGTSVGDRARLQATRAIDLLVVDSVLGDGSGFDVVRCLVAAHPGLKCIVITSADSAGSCPPDLAAWVVATVDKSEPCDALLAAIERAVGGQLKAAFRAPSMESVRTRLTPRECDVFGHLGRGLSNKEIATTLGISVQTVETHRKAISKKLGCNGASLVRLATLAEHLSLS